MFSQFHSSLIHASLYHGKVYFKVFFIVSKLIRDKIVLFTQRSILHIFEMLTKMLSSGSTDVKFNPPYIKHVRVFMLMMQKIYCFPSKQTIFGK